ncbi:MAG TPA: response regulator [Streptosporangiaceae bacterium]|nr:response regulator [Streptosporangiaceae bacterium]
MPARAAASGRVRACAGTADGTGYGIIGMRERAGLLHGQLTAGPRPTAASGWRPGCRCRRPQGPMTVRVVLTDDQPLVRAGLRVLIADTSDLDVTGEAGTGAQAVQLVRDLRPGVVVMDIWMPGMDGIEATQMITAVHGPARVVVLTSGQMSPSL